VKRLLYFLYYLKSLDIRRFILFIEFASQKISRSKTSILIDSIRSSFRYNISLPDYFYFRFYEKPQSGRTQWAGTGFMYEYQLKMNPRVSRNAIENKTEFLLRYKNYVHRMYATIDELKSFPGKAELMLKHPSGRIVVKDSCGQAGAEVEILQCGILTPITLIKHMHSRGFDLAEECVMQHHEMDKLSSSGINTIRIITQVTDHGVDFLGARLRISVNSRVDNMAAGNLAAPIDISTGRVTGPGVYSDITKTDEQVHPVTGVSIIGFQVPFWPEVCLMARDAALFDTRNRSVGWDIAITEDGPELIEGNHNWCKLLWQLPVKKGLKSELEKYL